MRRYPEYKDSGIEWIGDIPIDWNRVALKRVCNEITDGSHFSPATQNEGYPYITVKDIRNGYIDFDNCNKISKADYVELRKNGCQPMPNDVLLTKDGTIGKAVVIKEYREFVILSSLGLLRPNLSLIDPEFLRFFLISGINLDQMLSSIHGSALTRLTIKLIKDLIVVYPPLFQQRLLAHYLDHKTSQIDSLIEKKKRLIELLKEYRTAIITHAVTKGLDPNVKMKDSGIEWIGEIPEHWELKRFKRGISLLTDYEANGSFSSLKANTILDTGDQCAWFVRATDLENNILGFAEGNRYCNFQTYKFLSKTSLVGGELLVTKRGDIGKVYLMPRLNINATLAPNLYLVRLNKNLIPRFAFYWFTSDYGKSELISSNKSSTIGALYKDDIKDCLCIFPPESEQESISNFIDNKSAQINALIKAAIKQIGKLAEYRTSLISDAVTGKIDVRDYVEQVLEQAK